jgi:L-seryl-tRNA(Ser) seleniumtransferase
VAADPRRAIPRTDVLLADPRLQAAATDRSRAAVRQAVRDAQREARRGGLAPGHEPLVARALANLAAPTMRPVINATGVIVHTNLGRAPLADAAIRAVSQAAGYTDVEFDLGTGRRAKRGRGAIKALTDKVPAAEAALIVNNGAAALALAAHALTAADRPEIVVSRGELIEIGDGFRLPELLAATGARLVEVGTTNRTTVADYSNAVTDTTAFILKAHTSNYTIDGFTASVSVRELHPIGRPVVFDIGSGLLHPDPALPGEPDATSALRDGAAVVTASGDKLLGGPQAGVVLGRSEYVDRMRRHPIARAFRVDKLTLAALEATLRASSTPTAQALHADPRELRRRATAIAQRLAGQGIAAEAVATHGAVGGGGAPGLRLDSCAVAVAEGLSEPLRGGDPAVVGRVAQGRLLLDLRAVAEVDDAALVAAVVAATRA